MAIKLICLDFLGFLGDTMKAWKICVLCIIIGLMAVPAVSAEEEHAENSDTEDSPASAGIEYIVSPWVKNSPGTETISSLRSTQYITQGQTITHNVNVGSGVNYLEVDLDWGDTSDSLTLSIYTPSGSKIGTFHDNDDARIRFNIYPPQGYIEQGTWKFKVYGESVSGTEDYTFSVALH